MNEEMEFPETFEEFAKEYGFQDEKEVYTNGSDLIQIFRVKQWLENDNKLRKIEIDTAYECGKHENKWILVSDRLPVLRGMLKISDDVLITNGFENDMGYLVERKGKIFWHYYGGEYEVGIKDEDNDAIAWMPLPEPYKVESGGSHETLNT